MEYGEEKKTYGVLLPVLLVVALLIGYFYLKPGPSDKASPENGGELVLHTAPLQPQDVTVEKTYIGYVTPISDVDVIPYISGFLEDIYVEGGQEVAAGDTLIVIRQNEYKARMDAAAAQVLEAQANFNNAQVYYRRIRSAGARAVSTTPRHLICRPRRSWPPPKPTMNWQKSTMTIRLFRRPYRGLSATFR